MLTNLLSPSDETRSSPARQTEAESLVWLAHLLTQFEVWFATWQDDPQRWGLFDQFIREHLDELLESRQVRCYRLADGQQLLEPLTEQRDGSTARIPVDAGIIGHVIGSRQAFLRDQQPQGEHLRALAQQDPHCPAWCFPIVHGRTAVGVVAVGSLPPLARHETFLEAIARVVGLMWCRLLDHEGAAVARQTDPLSGVLRRADVLELGQQVLSDAAGNCEPVAAIAITLEGLRGLDDVGQWSLRDQLVERVGQTLRRRLRSDDLVGRFTDERFVALMRRLDLALGRVIAEKLIADLGALLDEYSPGDVELAVRGGLAASGSNQTNLDSLLTRAFSVAATARTLGETLSVCTEPVAPPSEHQDRSHEDR